MLSLEWQDYEGFTLLKSYFTITDIFTRSPISWKKQEKAIAVRLSPCTASGLGSMAGFRKVANATKWRAWQPPAHWGSEPSTWGSYHVKKPQLTHWATSYRNSIPSPSPQPPNSQTWEWSHLRPDSPRRPQTREPAHMAKIIQAQPRPEKHLAESWPKQRAIISGHWVLGWFVVLSPNTG